MSEALMNLEAEAALLGALMFDNSAVDIACERINADDFCTPIHGRIFEAIVKQSALGKSANPITIKPYFEGDEALAQLGGVGYLAQLSGNPAAMTAPATYMAHIADLSARRRMRAGLATAADACTDLDMTIPEIVAHADGAIADKGDEGINQVSGGQALAELCKTFGQPVDGVTCQHIPALDELLGPMRPKQLVIGAGRPGMGKTALALSYALGAAQAGHGVLFVSLEMSSTELAARMASDLCFDGDQPIPYGAIRDGDLSNWQQRQVANMASKAMGLPFQIVDAGSLTVGRLNRLIRRHARRMAVHGHKLELVVIDYLQLMTADTKGRSNYETVSEVSRGLKAAAKDHGVAVFALAQLSRAVESRQGERPQLSDLRDSGQIEQDADAVLFLLRQEYYLRNKEPDPSHPDHVTWTAALKKYTGVIEFILAKRRNGVVGNAFAQFHGKFQAVRG